MDEIFRLYAKTPVAKRSNSSLRIQRKKSSQPLKSPADRILFLQRTIGNQAVQRLIKSGTLKAKLKISHPGDRYEQEADKVADAVMRMPEPTAASGVSPHIQQACPTCGEDELRRQPIEEEEELQRQSVEEEEEELQAKENTGQTPEVAPGVENSISAIRGGGQPLSANERSFFEPRFGRDFSQVRVHSNAKATESARAVNARAYTVGQNVVFGHGEYAPGSSEGQRLLAHELVHIVQQDGLDFKNQHLFRFVSRERTEMGDLDETVNTASRVAKETGIWGLMRWGRFTAAMGGKGALEALTSPKSGSTARTPFPRYLYTCRCGLIDLRHFYQLMYIANLRSEETAVKKGIEHEKTAEAESRFAPEDITSNALGAEFGSQKSWVQRQSTFVSTLRTFLDRCKPPKWHQAVITPSQRDCVIAFYAVDVSGGSHRRKTAGTDSDPCNICAGTSYFPFKTDKSGTRIL